MPVSWNVLAYKKNKVILKGGIVICWYAVVRCKVCSEVATPDEGISPMGTTHNFITYFHRHQHVFE